MIPREKINYVSFQTIYINKLSQHVSRVLWLFNGTKSIHVPPNVPQVKNTEWCTKLAIARYVYRNSCTKWQEHSKRHTCTLSVWWTTYIQTVWLHISNVHRAYTICNVNSLHSLLVVMRFMGRTSVQLGLSNWTIMSTTYDQTRRNGGSGKSQILASKLEIRASQFVHKITTQFWAVGV